MGKQIKSAAERFPYILPSELTCIDRVLRLRHDFYSSYHYDDAWERGHLDNF